MNLKKDDSIDDWNILGMRDLLEKHAPYTFDEEWIKDFAEEHKPKTKPCLECKDGTVIIYSSPVSKTEQCQSCSYSKQVDLC